MVDLHCGLSKGLLGCELLKGLFRYIFVMAGKFLSLCTRLACALENENVCAVQLRRIK